MGGGKVGGKRGSKEGTRPPPRGFQILRGLSSLFRRAGPSASVPLQFPLPQHHVRMFELAPHIMLAVLRPNHRSGAESGNPHSRIGLLIQNLGRRQTGDIFGMGTRGERASERLLRTAHSPPLNLQLTAAVSVCAVATKFSLPATTLVPPARRPNN